MSNESGTIDFPQWGYPSITCSACRDEVRCHDDGMYYDWRGDSETRLQPFPPPECPACGNRGQNLVTWCRRCDRMYPAKAYEEHGDDAGYCPACCGNEAKAGPFYRRHPYADDGEGRCNICTEAERHCIHDEEDE